MGLANRVLGANRAILACLCIQAFSIASIAVLIAMHSLNSQRYAMPVFGLVIAIVFSYDKARSTIVCDRFLSNLIVALSQITLAGCGFAAVFSGMAIRYGASNGITLTGAVFAVFISIPYAINAARALREMRRIP